MEYGRNVTEDIAVLGSIPPQVAAAGTYLTPAIALGATSRKLVAELHTGALGGGNVAGSWVASATATGAYTAVAGSSFTIFGGLENIAQYELKAETLNGLNQGPFVKFQVVVAGGTGSALSALVFGACPHFESNSDNNIGLVASTIVL